MATEIATAYVSLIPSTSRIAPGVRSALGDVERDTARTSQNMGASLATGIGTGIAVVTSLLGGLTLKGGFDRALAIDNAQAKMKSLRYSTADIQGVMDTALASVKGTAFGLGDAASLATQLIAGGIKPGQDLARALGNTADIAAVANVSLGDLSPVMGQLASSSHLYTQDLLQLQQRGLPVFGWLAESLGKTQTEVRDMVSSGDVSFADLQVAIEQHVGGAAKATDSFKASLANVHAALSRTGAVIATPALAMLKGVFDQAIPAVDAITAKITPLVSTLVDRLAPVVTDLATRVSTWVQGTGGLTSGLSGLLPVLAPVAGLLAGLGGSGLVDLFGPLGRILPTISGPMGLILGVVAALLATSPELRGALGGAFAAIGGALQAMAPLLPAITGLFQGLASTLSGVLATVLTSVVVPLIQTLANLAVTALLPALIAVMGIVAEVAGALGGLLTQAITALMPPIMALISAALPVIVQIAMAILPVLAQVITMLAPIIGQLVQAFLPLLPVIGQLAIALLPVVVQLINALMPVIMALIPPILGVVEALAPLIAAFVQIIAAILPPLTQLFTGVLVPAALAVAQVFISALMPVITSLMSALQGLIKFLTGVFRGDWSQAWAGVQQMFSGVWDAITGAVSGIGAIFTKVPGIIKDAFGDAGKWLADVGGKIIGGLVDGLKGAFNKVKDALGDLTDLLPSWKGPASLDARLLTGNGQLIMRSLIAGFEDEAPAVQKYLAGFTTNLAATGTANINVNGSAGAQQGAGIDYDRLALAMSNVAISLDGRVVSDSVNQRIGVALR